MKSKFLSAFTAVAVALIASASPSFAAKMTPGQFNVALKQAVGTKSGPAAYNAAANLYKKALSDKNNKKFAIAYTNMVLKALKKPVKANLQGKSAAALANALTIGYFKGMAFKPQDSKFAKSLQLLIKKLPGSQKTDSTAQLIAQIVLKKGGTVADINFINQTVYNAAGQNPPPPVS
jgi:hypothetical protein